jgi:hypothetical protein
LARVEHECGVVQRLAANHAILSIHARVLHAHSTLPHKPQLAVRKGASRAVKFTILRFDRVGVCPLISASPLRDASRRPSLGVVWCVGVRGKRATRLRPAGPASLARHVPNVSRAPGETLACNTSRKVRPHSCPITTSARASSCEAFAFACARAAPCLERINPTGTILA